MKTYKIICITQIFNEIEKGNLQRFFRYAKPLFDEIIVYDDASTDGSYEYAKKHTAYIIRGNQNEFALERIHKQLLLEKALTFHPDFIVYLDADEVFSANAKEKLQELANLCIERQLDGLQFHKINLWRSQTWQRVDSLYDIGWFTHFWRVKKQMRYRNTKPGLHQAPYPEVIRKTERVEAVSVLHYGFSNDKNIAYKYLTYKAHGQSGYAMLDRLISEEKLQLKKVPKDMFPKGLYIANEKQPTPRTFQESLEMAERYKSEIIIPSTHPYSEDIGGHEKKKQYRVRFREELEVMREKGSYFLWRMRRKMKKMATNLFARSQKMSFRRRND